MLEPCSTSFIGPISFGVALAFAVLAPNVATLVVVPDAIVEHVPGADVAFS
jgi:hypothetical protein